MVFSLYKNGKPIIESPKTNLMLLVFGALIVIIFVFPILGFLMGLFN